MFLAWKEIWAQCSLQLPELALVLRAQSSVTPACCPRQVGFGFLWLLCCQCSASVVVAGVPQWHLSLQCWVGSRQARVPTVGCHQACTHFLAPNPSSCLWSCTHHHMQCCAFSSWLILTCRLCISVGTVLGCKVCGVLTGALQRGAPEIHLVYAVHSLGRTRLFLVMPHNPSPANPQAVFILNLWVLARDLQQQFLLCFVCNYIRRVALITALGSQRFPSSVFQEKSASGLCCWDHKQEWEWVDPELGRSSSIKGRECLFPCLNGKHIGTWAHLSADRSCSN